MPGKVALLALVAWHFACNGASAEMTAWMTAGQMRAHVERNMDGGKAYARDIQCGPSGGKVYVRLNSFPFSGNPGFFRWQWIVAPSAALGQRIAAIRLRERPELKYRVVRSMSFDLGGQPHTCALVYR